MSNGGPLWKALLYKSRSEEYLEKRNEQIVLAWRDGVKVSEIAKTLRMSSRGIYAILSRAGIPFYGGNGRPIARSKGAP